jgi:hypothetical protein
MTRKSSLWILGGAALTLWPAMAGAADPLPSPEVIKIGSAYIAKQLCSCLFVAERSEVSCRAEFKPQIDNVTVVIDRGGLPAKAKVTARVFTTLAEAVYNRRYGCFISK